LLYVWEAHPVAVGAAVTAAPGTVVSVSPTVQVQCGTDRLELSRVQRDGDAECAGAAWAALHGVRPGMVFE